MTQSQPQSFLRNNIIVPLEVQNWELLRNAKVEVIPEKLVLAGQKNVTTLAKLIINDKYAHTFGPTSRISKQLDHTKPEDIAARLTGGSFFFVNGELIDLRDSHYNGFIHDEDSINKMIELIGIRKVSRVDRKVLGLKTVSKDLVLSGIYDRVPIEIPQYIEGGSFESALMYNWNPFHSNIRGTFELVRLICTNGMIGVADFMNTNIPCINEWEENLEVAANQMQTKISKVVTSRMTQMAHEPATVAELINLADHASKRLVESTTRDNPLLPHTREMLNNIYKVVSPVLHLSKFYKPNVFSDMNIAAQMPGHLSTYDAMNVATEMYSHTEETDSSTGFALQKIANGLLFDSKEKRQQRLGRSMLDPLKSVFSNPNQAFFGKVS